MIVGARLLTAMDWSDMFPLFPFGQMRFRQFGKCNIPSVDSTFGDLRYQRLPFISSDIGRFIEYPTHDSWISLIAIGGLIKK